MHTNILRRLVHQYRRNYVFISGSAAIYDPWSPDDAQDLLRLLGQRLIAEGFSVVTGFGLGIGPFLLNGILDGLEARGSYSFDDRVILRPFPQGKITSEQRAARWTAYRKEMISYAGIALFLFGNRRNSDGSLKDAKGVVEEFDLAVAAGVAVVPIGSTGFAAELLHKRILENFENYYPNRPELRPAFEALGRSKENIVDMVVQILKKLREGG
jgi:hypothetical protein